jgi:hypothetical protein
VLRPGCPLELIRAVPILIRYAPSSLTREQYDKVNEILQENGPDGLWESEDAWQQAWDGGIKPALSAVGVELPEPDKFPVHELWGSSVPHA